MEKEGRYFRGFLNNILPLCKTFSDASLREGDNAILQQLSEIRISMVASHKFESSVKGLLVNFYVEG